MSVWQAETNAFSLAESKKWPEHWAECLTVAQIWWVFFPIVISALVWTRADKFSHLISHYHGSIVIIVRVGCSCWAGAGKVGGRVGSCWLSAVVCTKGYILHVTGIGNRYGSMSLPSVTRASHFHKDKRRARRPRRQQGPSLPLSWRLLGKCMSSYHRAARLAAALFAADPQAHPKIYISIKLNNTSSILFENPVLCTCTQ